MGARPSVLERCVERGDAERLETLLASGSCANVALTKVYYSPSGDYTLRSGTLIHLAVFQDDFSSVSLLLKHGADLRQQAEYICNPTDVLSKYGSAIDFAIFLGKKSLAALLAVACVVPQPEDFLAPSLTGYFVESPTSIDKKAVSFPLTTETEKQSVP
eukprot:TRINITY_DN2986_c0_g1_i1.p1 TRINITY_DN2986_c0_g1~~TRINITY_DN2986_c0_g1_i1.p1  ORF type:complete len:174 (+),score=19.96 TRINITY_DN2986_c0_g1_i1:47-523(+)